MVRIGDIMNTDLDIIIPCYNAKETLFYTLSSISIQRGVSGFKVYLVNDKSEIINNICSKPIDYLSLSKNLDKIKNESNSNSKSKNLIKEKLRPKSTQKMESKNIIKKKLLKISKNKNDLLDSKSRTISSKGNKNCNSKKKLINQ